MLRRYKEAGPELRQRRETRPPSLLKGNRRCKEGIWKLRKRRFGGCLRSTRVLERLIRISA